MQCFNNSIKQRESFKILSLLWRGEISTKDDSFSSIVSEHIHQHEKYVHDLHVHFPTLYGPLEDNLLEEGNTEEYSTDFEDQDEDLS